MSRHFPDLDPCAPENAPFVVGRLLEDGDGDELRWLVEQHGERRLAVWFRERAGRQLSRRSRCFWSVVLGIEPPASAELAEELWLL